MDLDQIISSQPKMEVRRAFESRDRLSLPVQFKQVRLDCDYRNDMLVKNKLIVEWKHVGEMRGIHEGQLLTQRKWAGMKIGLRMNFNVTKLKDGIKRFVL